MRTHLSSFAHVCDESDSYVLGEVFVVVEFIILIPRLVLLATRYTPCLRTQSRFSMQVSGINPDHIAMEYA